MSTIINVIPSIAPVIQQPLLREAATKVSQNLMQALQTGKFFKQERQLAKDFAVITPDELNQVVESFVKELGMQAHKQDPVKVLNELAELIPLESLQNAVKIKHSSSKDALQEAKTLLQEAKYYLEHTENKASMSFRAILSSILDKIIRIIESFLSAFGIAEFFKQPENEFLADMKFQKIMMLINMFTLVTTLIIPLIGAELAALIVGGTLLFIAALSIIYPYFRPRTSQLPEAKNLSKQMQQGLITCIGGRETAMDDTAKGLIASKTSKKHPCLIGQSGVGKTQTIEALVQAIESGKYPELTGKTVFYINVADLVNNKEMFGGGNRILSKICEAMGSNREDIILVLDEIHVACKKLEGNLIGEQLKSLLDDKPDNFPYVIGLTTEEDYYCHIYQDNRAFARRFKLIPIENTLEDVTLRIMSNALLHQSPNAIVEKGALKALWDKTQPSFKDSPQPLISLQILSQCVQKTSDTQKPRTKEEYDNKKNEVDSLYAQNAVTPQSYEVAQDDPLQQKIQTLEQELNKLNDQLTIEKEQQKHLFQAKDAFAQLKAEMFRTVVKVGNLEKARVTAKDKVQLNKFLLLSHYLQPALYTRIAGNKLGVKTIINGNLIDEVIKEEQAVATKAQTFIKKGGQQLQKRSRITAGKTSK